MSIIARVSGKKIFFLFWELFLVNIKGIRQRVVVVKLKHPILLDRLVFARAKEKIMEEKKDEKKFKKGFFARMFDKLDKELEEKAKSNPCCNRENNLNKDSCCS